MQNNIIYLDLRSGIDAAECSRPAADAAEFRRRADLRLRAAERRRDLLNLVETAVTALIGVGFALCIALVFTML